jgi:hypothetical protein
MSASDEVQKARVRLLTDDEYDPFAVFDAATGSGTVRDPYPKLAALRAGCVRESARR